MKKFRVFVLILLLAIAVPCIVRYRAWASHPLQAAPAIVTRAAENPSLRIVSPKVNEKLAQSFVKVQFGPVPGTAVSDTTYELRLDGGDPVETTDSSYTFNGLTPGPHEVAIQLVDSNDTAGSGALSVANFVVDPAAAAKVGGTQAANLPEPPLPLPPIGELPNVNSSLPLLSIIGFGILVGGVISALRTRPAHK